jgi:KDO2-lipid IV(A) lauroyltransferase
MELFFRALAWTVGRLPWGALRPLGWALGVLAFDVVRIRRAHVIASMRRAGLDPRAHARASYVSLGIGVFELLWLTGRPRASLEPLVRLEGWDRFEAARALGRGVVVATAHTGNWDLAACACAARTDLAVVTKRLSARGLDAFWQRARAGRGLDLIAAPDGGVLAGARARLDRGSSIALLVDQDPERTRGVSEAWFLGAPAACDRLPATLAARRGAPLVLALARREGATHVVEIVDVWTPKGPADAAWIDEATRALATRLDAWVRARPSQWMWLHRRWKTRLASPKRTQGSQGAGAENDRASESSSAA